MGAYEILAPILAVLVVAVLVSQCLIPELLGTPWFPKFRRVYKLREEVSQVAEQQVEKTLEQHLAEMREQLTKEQTKDKGENQCQEEQAAPVTKKL